MLGVWITRVAGAAGIGALGWQVGIRVSRLLYDQGQFLPWGLVGSLAGVLVGGLLAPVLVLHPWRKGVGHLSSLSGATLLAAALGLLAGLILAALVSIPLYRLPGWLSWGVPVMVSSFLGLAGLLLGLLRQGDLRALFPALASPSQPASGSRG
ncbi:MAG TPA: PIN domain nuclease, partial [Dehalococcoidia bacterium]|nr:PIN domain nuclease [Dehalococcoidia bacterium]